MTSDRWGWGDNANAKKSSNGAGEERSKGINPSSFYKNIRNTENPSIAEKQLCNILDSAARGEIVQKRHEFTSEQKIQREAYHAVTCFRVFPLQDLAMEYLSEMMDDYLGNPKREPQTKILEQDIFDVKDKNAQYGASGSHELSWSHCKRRRLGTDIHSQKYTDQFLAEKHYLPSVENCRNKELNGNCDVICKGKGRSQNQHFHFNAELWSMEPRIFALETSSTGKRKYIVANLGRFMQHYWRESDPQNRHFYELIPEGTPCRLYFDLEFSKMSNLHINAHESEVLMTEFIDELCTEFQLIYGIQISRDCIVDLDSSTDKKFSRHLIIHLPNGELFADACSAGVFAKRLVGRLAEELSTGVLEGRHATLAKYLFVNKNPPKTTNSPEPLPSPKRGFDNKALTCFVDLGVYTRNRLFRLMGSSKYGKPASSALRLADTNKFCFPAGFDNSRFYRTGTISHEPTKIDDRSNAPPPDRIRDYDAFCASMDWEAHARALSLTLVVPSNASKVNTPVLPDTDLSNDDKSPVKMLDSFSTRRHKKSTTRTCNGVSPIPELDAFILGISRQGGVPGKIRAWSMLDSNMSYQMSENRFCENIGRAHKSNNVIWIIDMTCKTYWQSCHDPECRAANFRGNARELPMDVGAAVCDYLLDQEIATMDEEKIIQKAKEMETINNGMEQDNLTNKHSNFSDPVLDNALSHIDMSQFRSRDS